MSAPLAQIEDVSDVDRVVSGKSICRSAEDHRQDRRAVRDNVIFLITESLDPFRYLLIAGSSSMNQRQLHPSS